MEKNPAKWRIIVPHTMSDTERCAVYDLFGIVDVYLPYPLAVSDETTVDPETCGENLIVLGTVKNGVSVQKLAAAGFLPVQSQREGYSIRAAKSPYCDDRDLIAIMGADEAGLLYAVHAFDLRYLRSRCRYLGYHYDHRFEAFSEAMPEWALSTYPKIDRRGVWSWGHVIYDYRAFFSNMSALGMNHLVIWNDFAPINAAEVIAEAHRRAIKIFWGFSCSWGEDVDPCDPREVDIWKKKVLDIYREQYAPLDVDGIYFQAFTETNDHEIGGRAISELITDWTISICGGLHEVYPGLEIEFGVHATPIGNEYAKLTAIDPDVALMWEDCGDFPYSYDPAKQDESKQAIAYTRELMTVHGADTRFAAVLKGFSVLNWKRFEHYHGPTVLGEAPRSVVKKRSAETDFTWNYARPYWIKGAPLLQDYLQTVAEAGVRETTVTALIEDGTFESELDPAAVLFAALLWDWRRDLSDVLCEAEHCAETRRE